MNCKMKWQYTVKYMKLLMIIAGNFILNIYIINQNNWIVKNLRVYISEFLLIKLKFQEITQLPDKIKFANEKEKI